MKIVVATEQFSPHRGYMEYYLAAELTKRGHDVYVVSFSQDSHSGDETHDKGFHTVTIPYMAVLGGYHVPTPRGIAAVVRLVKKTRPAIVHCHPLFSLLSLTFIGCQALFGHKIVGDLVTGGPIVVTHGMFTPNSIKSMLKYILARFATEVGTMVGVGRFFALSDCIKRVLLRHFKIPANNVAVISLAADSSLFRFIPEARSRIRRRLGISDTDLVVAYTGRIIPLKKVDMLVRAIAPVMHRKPNVKLLIVGSGNRSYLDYLRDLCSNHSISPQVIFHPFVHRTQLHEFYSASDIAVWPGGPSISIIEAAAVGLPLIIEKSPFTKYILSYSNGFSIASGDATELTTRLRDLIDNRGLRIQMGHRSRQLVEDKLNWESIAGLYEKEYWRVYQNMKNKHVSSST